MKDGLVGSLVVMCDPYGIFALIICCADTTVDKNVLKKIYICNFN